MTASERVLRASIVICTKNQAPRLRLVLRGLSVQSVPPLEVIVVDDGSTDGTAGVVARAAELFPPGVLRFLRRETSGGSATARNEGASTARGEVLVFLDSDALPTRVHVAEHVERQREGEGAVVIGPLWHITTTEFLKDPTTGELFDLPVPATVRAALERDASALLVTEEDVTSHFDSRIVRRAARGTYPHLAHQELEAESMRERVDGHPMAWTLMTPQNVSIPRSYFERVGGFDATLPFSEGWDLTLSLMSAGLRVVRAASAPIYHLYHHHDFGNFGESLRRFRAQQRIARKHDRPSLVLVPLAFRIPAGDPMLPEELQLRSLDQLARVVERYSGEDLGPYAVILAGHPQLSELQEALEVGATPCKKVGGDSACASHLS